jgi:hypothetical protein
MTANLAKASTNANGNVTIGHYILGTCLYTMYSHCNCQIGKSLGKGTFGLVKQGTHVLTGEKVSFTHTSLGEFL